MRPSHDQESLVRKTNEGRVSWLALCSCPAIVHQLARRSSLGQGIPGLELEWGTVALEQGVLEGFAHGIVKMEDI